MVSHQEATVRGVEKPCQRWPRVSTVVVTWNNFDQTSRAIDSLLHATYPCHEVMVVDNGSTDGSIDRLQRSFPTVRFIRNPSNYGFARGCNVGIRDALDRGADYVLLLNSDCVVEPGFLEPAVTLAECDASIGLVGGKMYLDTSARILWYAGGEINRWLGRVKTFGGQIDRGQFDRPREITFVSGAMMLIKRRILLDVGLLSELYFFGGEERDYCLRAQRAGFKLYYAPDFVCSHRSDGSHSNSDPKFIYNGVRNKLITQQRHLPPTAWWLWRAIYRLYLATYAQMKVRRLHASRQRRIDMRDIMFAMKSAVADHEPLRAVTEGDLIAFEERLRREYAARRESRQRVRMSPRQR